MANVIQMFLDECSNVIDRFPLEARWDIASAILAEPEPFFRVMAHVLDNGRGHTGKRIRPFCSGIVGAMLIGNYENGGFIHNPNAGIGQLTISSPDWHGSEEGIPIINSVIIFAGYSDELPALRAIAIGAGLEVFDEFAFKGTVTQEQP